MTWFPRVCKKRKLSALAYVSYTAKMIEVVRGRNLAALPVSARPLAGTTL